MPDHYGILRVSPDADAAAIRRAYKKRAFEVHPDKNPDDAEAEAKFKEVAQAWHILGDESRRAAYDSRRRAGYDDDDDDDGTANGYGYGGGASWDHAAMWADIVRETEREAEARRRRERALVYGCCRSLVVFAALMASMLRWCPTSPLFFPGPLHYSNRKLGSECSPRPCEFKVFINMLKWQHIERLDAAGARRPSRARPFASVADAMMAKAAARMARLNTPMLRAHTPYLRLAMNGSDIRRLRSSEGQPRGALLLRSPRKVGAKVHDVWTFVQPAGRGSDPPTPWPPSAARHDEVLCVRLLKSGTITSRSWYSHVSAVVDGRLRPFGLTAVRHEECGRATGAMAWGAAVLGALALPPLLLTLARLMAACCCSVRS